MSQPFRPVDQYGFPIPVTFDDPPRERGPRNPRSVKCVRFTLVLIGLALVAGALVKSVGRGFVADYLQKRAEQRYLTDEVDAAIADLDRAIAWTPDNPSLYLQRGYYRQEANDLDGSLADIDKLIELSPYFPPAYAYRSIVYQRQERHREAINDLSKAIEFHPRKVYILLNQRAYARAIANLDLKEALDDIERAILMAGENAAYLDTRGYVLYRLGRYDEALVDLERAVELMTLEAEKELALAEQQGLRGPQRKRAERLLRENEAVIIYHRGEIHEKLGNRRQAAKDLARGKALGYNPAEGVY